jgi:transposase-like protein
MPVSRSADPWCMSFLDDMRKYATEFSGNMKQVHDIARKAGVYPGTLRDTRRKYRLDWSGWDR